MLIEGKDVRLPKKFKADWVKALRSGMYQQGIGQLLNETEDEDGNPINTYCCLGVACKITGNSPDYAGFIEDYHLVDKKRFPTILKEENLLTVKLSKFNDDKKWSFKKIAAYIERNL